MFKKTLISIYVSASYYSSSQETLSFEQLSKAVADYNHLTFHETEPVRVPDHVHTSKDFLKWIKS